MYMYGVNGAGRRCGEQVRFLHRSRTDARDRPYTVVVVHTRTARAGGGEAGWPRTAARVGEDEERQRRGAGDGDAEWRRAGVRDASAGMWDDRDVVLPAVKEGDPYDGDALQYVHCTHQPSSIIHVTTRTSCWQR